MCINQGPTWASTNLGVFVCMRCSGIHRSLGTHISKVKSTVLDNWKPPMVARMAAIGNEIAKRIYESGVPANYPKNFTDQHQLVSWIRNKYEHKRWYNPSADPASEEEEEETLQHSTPVSHHVANHGSAGNGHAHHEGQRQVVSAPTSPIFSAEDDVSWPSTTHQHHHPPHHIHVSSGHHQSHSLSGTFTGAPTFGEFTSVGTQKPGGDLFGQNGAASATAPLPQVKTASGQVETDLFSTQVAQGSPQPKPVDKSLLASAYNSTPYGQAQLQQQQQQQMMLLQQQAYLAQQQQFQAQLAGQMMAPVPQHAFTQPGPAQGMSAFASPTNAFSSPTSAFAAPQNAFSSPTNAFAAPNNAFAPNAFSSPANAFSSPANAFSSPTNAFSGGSFAPAQPGTFSTASFASQPATNTSTSLLASLYHSSPSSNGSTPPMGSTPPNTASGGSRGYAGNSYSFPSPATTPNAQTSLSFAMGAPISSPSSTSSSVSLI